MRLVVTLLALLSAGPAAAGPLGPNRGDITGDGAVTVADINCFIAAALASLTLDETPACQAVPDAQADMQCDGAITVADVQRVIVTRLYLLAPGPELADLLRAGDADLDGLHDACPKDKDVDGVLDAVDVCPEVPDPGQEDMDGDGIGDACDADHCTGVVCAVGGPCSLPVCVPETGACGVIAPDGHPCDADGSGCTEGDACVSGVCEAGPVVDCGAAGDGCSVGVCVSTGIASFVCASDPTPLEGAPCDDGELCTMADSCEGGSCGGPSWPACEDATAGLVCLLSGAAGAQVACAVHLVRSAQVELPAVNLQAHWSWDTGAATLDVLQDGTKCFTPTFCVPWLIPTYFTALQSNHQVSLTPSSPAAWTGSGFMLIANAQSTNAPLTDAWLEGPVVQGDPVLFTAFFTLKVDVDAAAPVPVTLSGIVMTDKELQPLQVDTLNLVIRTSLAP